MRTDTDEDIPAVRELLAATANPERPEEVDIARPSDAIEAKAAARTAFTSLLLGLGAVALLVGGVGIANVKWLGSIRVARTTLRSTWNTTSYRKVGPTYPADAPPLTALPLKSAFELGPNATFPVGRPFTLRGRSWSGGARPRSVDVSTDGGAPWRPAHTYGPNHEPAWLRWQLEWTPTVAGPTQLLARATDERGHQQPLTVPFNRDGYEYDGVFRLPATVVA